MNNRERGRIIPANTGQAQHTTTTRGFWLRKHTLALAMTGVYLPAAAYVTYLTHKHRTQDTAQQASQSNEPQPTPTETPLALTQDVYATFTGAILENRTAMSMSALPERLNTLATDPTFGVNALTDTVLFCIFRPQTIQESVAIKPLPQDDQRIRDIITRSYKFSPQSNLVVYHEVSIPTVTEIRDVLTESFSTNPRLKQMPLEKQVSVMFSISVLEALSRITHVQQNKPFPGSLPATTIDNITTNPPIIVHKIDPAILARARTLR